MRKLIRPPLAIMAALLAAPAAIVTVGLPSRALAGGQNIPDLGTEALGRGGAFTAKADSPLALYYNVAGMARQQGTRLLIDVNLLFHDMSFTRAGVYAGDPSNPLTPYAGQPYPTVHNLDNFGYQPFIGLTTDLGFFEHLKFGLGAFAPPGIGKRQYGDERDVAVVGGKTNQGYSTPRYEVQVPGVGMTSNWNGPGQSLYAPSPARYDLAATNFTIFMPTFAVALNPWTKYLDLGLAVHWVVAEFDITKANVTPLGSATCVGSPEYPGCDSYALIHASAQSYGFTASAMIHPIDWIDIGLSFRPQININATGTGHAYPTAGNPLYVPDFDVAFSTMLPHEARLGIRAVSRYLDGTERADIEVDGVYENWSAETTTLTSNNFPLVNPSFYVDATHHFTDGGSFRLGGQYNFRLSDTARFILRGGFFFDAATTHYADTHLDAYSMAKYAGTLGVGLKFKGFTINAAYAGMYLPSRTVTNETATATSAYNGSKLQPGIDVPVVYGNGRYDAHIHTVSIGVTINFSEFGHGVLFQH